MWTGRHTEKNTIQKCVTQLNVPHCIHIINKNEAISFILTQNSTQVAHFFSIQKTSK